MFIRQFCRQRKICNVHCTYVLRKSSQQAKEKTVVNQDFQLDAHEQKTKPREPFVKNLFLAKYDREMMVYPEVEKCSRYHGFRSWLKTVEEYVKHCCRTNQQSNKEEILSQIQQFDVLRACITEEYHGLGLCETEILKLVETLSNIPWLGTYFIKNYITPVRVMNQYGSDDQKNKYYSKIMSGKLIPTMCLHELDDASNGREIKTRAIMNSDGSWLLNGRKTFVVNGSDSNFFFVFAHCVEDETKVTPKTLSLFLVERDFGGITCSDLQDTVGARDTPVCTVNFDNTIVPKENVIGAGGEAYEILLQLIRPGEQDMAGYAITTLRNFMNEVMLFATNAKHMNKNLHDIDAVQHIISRMSCAVYGMESVAYLTSGIVDHFNNQDVTIEKAITETYCANECVRTIFDSLQVIGPRNYSRKYPFMKMFEDSIALTTFDGYNIDGNLYIASLGLQHSGKDLAEHVKKIRNFMAHPLYVFKQQFLNKYQKLHIAENLHPSLLIGADQLEMCINELHDAVVCLFHRYGTEVLEKHMDLFRLSELVSEIYVSAAMLGRASRSYCTGLRNSEDERNTAVCAVYSKSERIRILANQLKDGEYTNGDYNNKKLATSIFQHYGYPFAHPMERTV